MINKTGLFGFTGDRTGRYGTTGRVEKRKEYIEDR
jgi:hypothetical protein